MNLGHRLVSQQPQIIALQRIQLTPSALATAATAGLIAYFMALGKSGADARTQLSSNAYVRGNHGPNKPKVIWNGIDTRHLPASAPPPPAASPPPPPAPARAPAPVADNCDLTYKFVLDQFKVHGKNFDVGKDGIVLKEQIAGCGDITGCGFETPPHDPTYQWYAHDQLPIGTKPCVGRPSRRLVGAPMAIAMVVDEWRSRVWFTFTSCRG